MEKAIIIIEPGAHLFKGRILERFDKEKIDYSFYKSIEYSEDFLNKFHPKGFLFKSNFEREGLVYLLKIDSSLKINVYDKLIEIIGNKEDLTSIRGSYFTETESNILYYTKNKEEYFEISEHLKKYSE